MLDLWTFFGALRWIREVRPVLCALLGYACICMCYINRRVLFCTKCGWELELFRLNWEPDQAKNVISWKATAFYNVRISGKYRLYDWKDSDLLCVRVCVIYVIWPKMRLSDYTFYRKIRLWATSFGQYWTSADLWMPNNMLRECVGGLIEVLTTYFFFRWKREFG